MTSSVMVSCHPGVVRADRLLSLVYLLKARGMTSAPELARLLEVSPRTILRDVEALSVAGVPVYSQPGRGGGIALLPGYRTDVSGLSEREASALFAAIAAPGADALGLGEALTSALRKIMAAVPDAHRPSAARLSERVVIDTTGWLPRPDEPTLAAAQEAVLGDRRARIRYQGRKDDAATTRTVDPYGLLHSGGSWFVVAGHDGRTRFYRLARISAIEVLDEPAVRPEGLDLRAVWAERRRGYQATLRPLTVEMWVRPRRIADLSTRAVGAIEGIDPTGWPAPGGGAPDWTAVRAGFGDVSHAWAVLRDLDADAVVVAPADLRERVLSRARATVAVYGDEDHRRCEWGEPT